MYRSSSYSRLFTVCAMSFLLLSALMRGCLRVTVASCALLASVCCAQLPAASAPAPQKPDVIFVPTPKQIVDLMLLMAEVKKTDVVYDLGCGDGRLVILAAK